MFLKKSFKKNKISYILFGKELFLCYYFIMKNISPRSKSALLLIISAVAIAIDQLTKWAFFGSSYSLIGDFLWIESSFNTGAAFSMFSGATWVFIVVTIICCVFMVYLLFTQRITLSMLSKVCITIILGGAIGNLIDRIFLAGVRDFIYFKSINFAIFNFADAFITVGAILLAISLIISLSKAKKTEKKQDGNNQ